jgi:purine-binding chemotaxis protein CheW
VNAPETTAADDRAADRQFVAFSVAGEMFAVPMAPVQEIIRVPEVARLPLAPPALDGLANLRGRVLPIMNLRRILAADARANDDATRALVIHVGQPLGFVVDRVASVLHVEPGEIEPADALQRVVRSDYLTGVIKRPPAHGDGPLQLLMVLDFERLVRDQFASLAGRAERRDAAAEAGAAPAGDAAAHEAGEGEAAAERRLVSFTVCAQEYALDIGDVQEIVQLPEGITAVPGTPAHVLGLMSLRRRLLPLVGLRALFGLPRAEAALAQRVVVVALPGGATVGLVTDTVKEVLSVPRGQLEPVPGVLVRGGGVAELESICRLDEGRRLVSLIAADRLLGLDAVRDALAAAAGAQEDPVQSHEELRHRGDTAGDEDTQVVVFRLGAEEFGVPIMSVQEIVRLPETLTRVPRAPAFVEGVINLRGTVLPVVDQRRRLGLPDIARSEGQRIMVYTVGGQRTGFIVDAVAEVLRIARSHVEPAPDLGEGRDRLIAQVAKLDGGRRLVMLIDPAQLLGAREVQALRAAPGEASPADVPVLAQAA